MTLSPIVAALAAANNGNGFAVYCSGQEPEANKLARTYAALRLADRHFEGRPPHATDSDRRKRYARPYTAAEALAEARRKVAAGDVLPWPSRNLASYQNAPGERGGRWIERPDLAGLRFIGFADDLARLDHKGWFQSEDGDGDVYRGAVYAMPARSGRSVYVEAYVSGASTRDGWRESSTGGRDESRMPAVLFLSDRHSGEPGGHEGAEGDDSARRDAASGADSEAESAADREREYNAFWQAGRQAAEAVESAADYRKEARELMRELRDLAGIGPAVCAELRGSIGRKLRKARKAYAEAAKLWDDCGDGRTWRPDLAGAFRDGADAASYWESRK